MDEDERTFIHSDSPLSAMDVIEITAKTVLSSDWWYLNYMCLGLHDFYEVDSRRQRFVEIFFDWLKNMQITKCMRWVIEVMKIFKTDKEGALKDSFTACSFEINNISKRSMAVSLLEYLINSRNDNLATNVLAFYNNLASFFSGIEVTLKRVGAGGFKTFAQATKKMLLIR